MLQASNDRAPDAVPLTDDIPDEVLALMREVVGPFDKSLTREQGLLWGRHINQHSVNDLKQQMNGQFANSLRATLPDDNIMFGANGCPPYEDGDFVLHMNGQAAITLNVLYDGENASKLFEFMRAKSLKGFAGDKCPEHTFPAPNMWFEVIFNVPPRPVFAPRNDMTKLPVVTVSSIAIHVLAESPQKAQIVAWIRTDDGDTLMYSGVIEYGKGGAHVFPVRTIREARTAYVGEIPEGAITDKMSNGSQFVAGMLAYILEFAKVSNQSFEPINEVTEADLEIGLTSD